MSADPAAQEEPPGSSEESADADQGGVPQPFAHLWTPLVTRFTNLVGNLLCSWTTLFARLLHDAIIVPLDSFMR